MNVVNLNKQRKARTRTQARKKADENAAKHGQSKAARLADARAAAKQAHALDAHKREE